MHVTSPVYFNLLKTLTQCIPVSPGGALVKILIGMLVSFFGFETYENVIFLVSLNGCHFFGFIENLCHFFNYRNTVKCRRNSLQ